MADDEANEANGYFNARPDDAAQDAACQRAAADQCKTQIPWRGGDMHRIELRDHFDDQARQIALIQAIGAAKDNIIKTTTEEIVATARTFYDFLTGVEIAGEPTEDEETEGEYGGISEVVSRRAAKEMLRQADPIVALRRAGAVKGEPADEKPEPTEWR